MLVSVLPWFRARVMCAVGKAVDLNKQRSPKQLSQSTFAIPEQSDSSVPNSGRTRGNLYSESSDTSSQSVCSTTSPTTSTTTGPPSDTSGHDSDCSEIHSALLVLFTQSLGVAEIISSKFNNCFLCMMGPMFYIFYY